MTDIVWQYITTLSSYSEVAQNQSQIVDMTFATRLRLLPHPWRLCYLAGDVATEMVEHMHGFLTTLAVILQSAGVEMRLKCLCFQAWTFQLTVHEQDLLFTLCNLLAAVGGVLADTSEESMLIADEHDRAALPANRKFSSTHAQNGPVVVKQLENVSKFARLEASSRSQLLPCLLDGTSETFWESGEEVSSVAYFFTPGLTSGQKPCSKRSRRMEHRAVWCFAAKSLCRQRSRRGISYSFRHNQGSQQITVEVSN